MFSEISRMGKNSVVYGIGQLLQRLVSILLIPLYTAYFVPSEYGINEILGNTSSVMLAALGLGLASGMYRSYFMYSDEERRQDVAKTALVTFAASSLVAGALIFFARPLSRLLLADPSRAPLLVLMLLFVILGNIVSVPFAILRARNQATRFVVLSLVQFLSNTGLTVFLVAVAKRGVQGNWEGSVGGQLVVLACFAPLLLGILKARFSRVDLKEMLSFGLPLVPAMLASLSLTVSDRYFLRAFSTLDEVGVYGLGYRVGLTIQVVIVTPFMLSWGPVMWSVADKPYANKFYAKVMTYFSAVALYVTLAMSMFGPELIRLLSRQEAYWEAWRVIPLITLSYVLYGVYYQACVGLNLRKKTQYISVIVVGAAALNLLLNFLLIPPWGMMGAAWATLIGYLFLAVLAIVVSQRFYPFAYEWLRLLKLGLTLGLCYGVSQLIPPGSLWVTVLLKVALLLLCPVALWLIRFFSPEEISRGREIWNRGRGRLAALLQGRSRTRS